VISVYSFGFMVIALAAVVTWSSAPARAETPSAVCTRIGTDDTLQPIPENLVPAVNAVFGIRMPIGMAVDTTVFRCVDGHVLVCTTGANLPCGQANSSRTPGAGAVGWCHDHPDSTFIPAVATGHDTIYAWRCLDRRPKVIRQTQRVDARGFFARYWREVR
jgi:hypothetical protein